LTGHAMDGRGVWEVKRGDTIVIAELETLVQSVREHEGNWYISYTHPKTGVKTEEFYTPNASVYMQLPQEGK